MLLLLTVLAFVGCSKQENAASQDSLFSTPLNPAPARAAYIDSNGLFVDSFMVQQQPDIERLKSILPVRVVEIYRDFQPLRNHSTTAVQLDSFLRTQKISPDELHSVLAEGDRLGWGKAGQRK